MLDTQATATQLNMQARVPSSVLPQNRMRPTEMPTTADLMGRMESLGLLVLGLIVLVLILGIFVTRGQRRIARNQVELADLVRQLVSKGGGATGSK